MNNQKVEATRMRGYISGFVLGVLTWVVLMLWVVSR